MVFDVKFKPVPKGAHPTDLAGGIPEHKGVWGNRLRDHSPSPYKGIRTDVVAADDGGIGPNGRALAHTGFGVLVSSHHRTAGVGDVRKDATRAEKHIVFTLDTRV